MRGDERDHETQQADALDVLVDKLALHHPVREIDDADQFVVIHEREADKRAGREILVT